MAIQTILLSMFAWIVVSVPATFAISWFMSINSKSTAEITLPEDVVSHQKVA